jgi:hypothetical protein
VSGCAGVCAYVCLGGCLCGCQYIYVCVYVSASVCAFACVGAHARVGYMYICVVGACNNLCCVCTYIYATNALFLCKLDGKGDLSPERLGMGPDPDPKGFIPGPAPDPDSSKFWN